MQDSIELNPSDDQPSNHNQFQFHSVVSPKGRTLIRGSNLNTASQESLTYSNSTYQKNQFTQRSPPLFNIQNFSNNQNIYADQKKFNRKQSAFRHQNGVLIQFDKIKEESYLSDQNDQSYQNQSSLKQRIDFPYFLSNQNSPKKFNYNDDSLNQEQLIEKQNPGLKKYTKIIPTSRKEIKDSIVRNINQKIQLNASQKPNKNKNKTTPNQKTDHSIISNTSKRSKSPFQLLNKGSSSQFKASDEIANLRQKIKELEYSLKVESISTEELRTKVSVLNELLEQKFLERNGINFKLFKNSSPHINKTMQTGKVLPTKQAKSYSNIDLYVEMKVLQKAKQQLEIQFERIKVDLIQKTKLLDLQTIKCDELAKKLLNKQNSKQQYKTQTSFTLCQDRRRKDQFSQQITNQLKESQIFQKLKNLEQQQKALNHCIENQNIQIQVQDKKIADLTDKLNQQAIKTIETQNYLRLFEEKEKRFTEIQRPKFIFQIQELTEKLTQQKEQIEKLEMQNNLIQLQLSQPSEKDQINIQSPLSKNTDLFHRSPIQKSQSLNKSSIISSKVQDAAKNGSPSIKDQDYQQKEQQSSFDAMSLIMLQQQQLKLLKTQRDYFRSKNQSLKLFQQENYKLRLKNEDLQNQLHSLHQLIEVDDEITF